MDWDDAYANGAYIPGAEAFPGKWADEAQAFRAKARGELDVPYADGPRNKLDLFLPKDAPKGLFIFVHGGYWLDFDKSSWSHFASGAVENGWAAALPSYDLAPGASIAQITQQIAAATAKAAEHVGGPIVVAGHSAGGHLAARMMCEGILPPALSGRVVRALAISGLFDLRPLMHTKMNASFKLDDASASAESPILLAPKKGADVIAWVGADERPEFLRQSKDFVAAWFEKGARVRFHAAEGRHHFNVLDDLLDPTSAMLALALGD